jgi:hypothetical protein
VPDEDVLETRVLGSQAVAEIEEAVWECVGVGLESGHAPFALVLAFLVQRLPVVVDDQSANCQRSAKSSWTD